VPSDFKESPLKMRRHFSSSVCALTTHQGRLISA
jgi:hypothetical protein